MYNTYFAFSYRIPLQISYTARTAGHANFNAVINVTRKTKPLTVNAKASGYAMTAQLLCENSQGGKVELSAIGLNAINLGEVRCPAICMRVLVVFVAKLY